MKKETLQLKINKNEGDKKEKCEKRGCYGESLGLKKRGRAKSMIIELGQSLSDHPKSRERKRYDSIGRDSRGIERLRFLLSISGKSLLFV